MPLSWNDCIRLLELCSFLHFLRCTTVQDKVGSFLGTGSGHPEHLGIILKLAHPALEIRGRVLNGIVINADLGAEHGSGQFGHEFFEGVIVGAKVVSAHDFLTIQARSVPSRVCQFMKDRAVILGRVRILVQGGHLDFIGLRAIERLVGAFHHLEGGTVRHVINDSLSRRDGIMVERLGRLGGQLGGQGHVLSVRDIENVVIAQERNLCRIAVGAFHFRPVPEENRDSLGTLANAAATLLSLLKGQIDRDSIAQHRHKEVVTATVLIALDIAGAHVADAGRPRLAPNQIASFHEFNHASGHNLIYLGHLSFLSVVELWYNALIKGRSQHMTDNQFRVHSEFPEYHVYPNGKIWSTLTKKWLKLSKDSDGYRELKINAKRRIKAHRLVAELYLPNPDNLPFVNHLDGNKQNNHIENLEWASPAMNSNHASFMGLLPRGENNTHSILKSCQVREILQTYKKR